MPLIWCHMGEPCVPSARSKGNDPTWRREPVSQIPEKHCLFSSNHQKSFSPGEPVSGYLDCLGGMELAQALTGSAPMSTRPEGKKAWVMELIPALTAPGLLEEEAST